MKQTYLIALVIVIIGFVAVLKSSILCTPAQARCTKEHMESNTSVELAPSYFTYSEDLLGQSLAAGKRVVLYFHAPWCNTCTSFDDELVKQVRQLPSDTIVLKIDYDSSALLKQQYQVTYQHTLVLLDRDGNTKEMWIGGDLVSLLEYLKQ